MSNDKKGFVLYFDSYPAILSLPSDQRGWLLSALFVYADRVWQDTAVSLDEVLEEFPQLSDQAMMACRLMGTAIYRDTRRWLDQREYRLQRRQTQGTPSTARPGLGPDPGRKVQRETPEEYNRRLEWMAELARQE